MGNCVEVTFLGTGGSCSYNNISRKKYGVNTSCVAVKAGEETIILDAGTGACGFGGLDGYQKDSLHMFFTHYHIDHINGLLFFPPLFDSNSKIELYGGGDKERDHFSVIDNFLSPPLHPVGIKSFNASCGFHTVKHGDSIALSENVNVRIYELSHPGGALGFRIDYEGRAVCYCTDVELSRHENDKGLLEFMHKADLIILDSFFCSRATIPGWGHSSWREAAEWAKRAEAKGLALFHYDFMNTDAEIMGMEDKAKKIFPNTFASADHMVIEI